MSVLTSDGKTTICLFSVPYPQATHGMIFALVTDTYERALERIRNDDPIWRNNPEVRLEWQHHIDPVCGVRVKNKIKFYAKGRKVIAGLKKMASR